MSFNFIAAALCQFKRGTSTWQLQLTFIFVEKCAILPKLISISIWWASSCYILFCTQTECFISSCFASTALFLLNLPKCMLYMEQTLKSKISCCFHLVIRWDLQNLLPYRFKCSSVSYFALVDVGEPSGYSIIKDCYKQIFFHFVPDIPLSMRPPDHICPKKYAGPCNDRANDSKLMKEILPLGISDLKSHEILYVKNRKLSKKIVQKSWEGLPVQFYIAPQDGYMTYI